MTQKDIPYCGVDQLKIQNANPVLNQEVVKLHRDWIVNRYTIFKKRKEGLEAPWTDDPILQKYRFTNVFREDDKESQYLIQNISLHPDMSMEMKIYNTILFRCFNKFETLLKLDGPWKEFPVDLQRIKDKYVFQFEKDKDYVWFTNAFNTGGIKQATGGNVIIFDSSKIKNPLQLDPYSLPIIRSPQSKKILPDAFLSLEKYAIVLQEQRREYKYIQNTQDCIPLRIVNMVNNLFRNSFHEKILSCLDQKELFDLLTTVQGLGPFLAYQIFVDLTYIPGFPFSEREFTVAGPGCKRGLNNYFVDMGGLSYEEALFWVRDNMDKILEDHDLSVDFNSLFSLRPENDRYLNIMSLENTFCELSKYVKAFYGIGKPKNKYHGEKSDSLFEE